jgi:hypothetical protein
MGNGKQPVGESTGLYVYDLRIRSWAVQPDDVTDIQGGLVSFSSEALIRRSFISIEFLIAENDTSQSYCSWQLPFFQ